MKQWIGRVTASVIAMFALWGARGACAEIVVFDDAPGTGWSKAWQMSYQTFNVHSGTAIWNNVNDNMLFTHDGLDVDTNYVLKTWVNTRTEEGMDLLLRISYTNETETEEDIPFDDRNEDSYYWIDGVPVTCGEAITDADTNTWQCVQIDLTQTNWTGWPYVEHHFNPTTDHLTEILWNGDSTNSGDHIFLIDDVSLIDADRVVPTFTWTNRNEPSSGDSAVLALWHFDDLQTGTTVADWAANYDLTMCDTGGPNTGGWATGGSWNVASNSGYLAANRIYFATHDTADIDIDWTRDLTISFWCRGSSSMTGTIQNHAFYLGRDDSWSPPRSQMTFTHGYSNPLESRMRSSSTNLTFDFDDSAWHHVGMVYNYHSVSNATVSTYIDNTLKGAFPATDNTSIMQVMRVGCSWGKSHDSIWWGDIDEFLIYRGVMTDFSDGYRSPGGSIFAFR